MIVTAAVATCSDEELAEQIRTWSARCALAEARLLDLIAEFDEREAWAGVGLLSCAHWLSWQCGFGLKAAHERVRVARRLRELPSTRAALADGTLSWSQVRAITRVATPADEATYVACAQHATGEQLEKLARGVRRARRHEQDQADPEAAAHRLRTTVRYDEDGTLVLTARVGPAQAPVVLAALEAAQADLDADRRRQAAQPDTGERSREPDRVRQPARDAAAAAAPAPVGRRAAQPEAAQLGAAPSPPRATLSDGLLRLAQDYLRRRADLRPSSSRRDRAALVLQLDPLSGWARTRHDELLPPDVLCPSSTLAGETRPPARRRRLLPFLPVRPVGLRAEAPLRPLRAADLRVRDLGRTAREPDLALRELLGVVDGERCRFPGCSRVRALHAHHVRWWSDGGATDLANLLLLCSRHHMLVHADGYLLELLPDRRLRVRTVDGTVLPARPVLSPADPAALLALPIGSETSPPTVTPLHLHYAVGVLLQHAA